MNINIDTNNIDLVHNPDILTLNLFSERISNKY